MFTTGLQGIHDEMPLEISKEQLIESYFNRGWLFILSRWLFGYNHLLWRLLIGWKRKAMIEYFLMIIDYQNILFIRLMSNFNDRIEINTCTSVIV